MGRFDISPEVAEEYRGKFSEAVEPHVDEEVLAVGTFRTTGSGSKYAISKTQAGALAYGAASLMGKKKAGGLPGQFLLAVTPTKLHAFKYKIRGRGYTLQDEVAVWDRPGLRFSTENKMGLTMLTIESPAEGEKVTLAPGGIKDDPWTQEVIRVLQNDVTEPAQR